MGWFTFDRAAELYAAARKSRGNRCTGEWGCGTVHGAGGVRLAHATFLHKREAADGVTYAVAYHETDIVTLHADGRVTLATGGWLSKRTAERIGEYAPGYGTVQRGITGPRHTAHKRTPRIIILESNTSAPYWGDVVGELSESVDTLTLPPRVA